MHGLSKIHVCILLRRYSLREDEQSKGVFFSFISEIVDSYFFLNYAEIEYAIPIKAFISKRTAF